MHNCNSYSQLIHTYIYIFFKGNPTSLNFAKNVRLLYTYPNEPSQEDGRIGWNLGTLSSAFHL